MGAALGSPCLPSSCNLCVSEPHNGAVFALEPDSFSRTEVNTSPLRFQETAFDWTALLAPEGVVWGVRGHNDGANLGVGFFGFFSLLFSLLLSPGNACFLPPNYCVGMAGSPLMALETALCTRGQLWCPSIPRSGRGPFQWAVCSGWWLPHEAICASSDLCPGLLVQCWACLWNHSVSSLGGPFPLSRGAQRAYSSLSLPPPLSRTHREVSSGEQSLDFLH